MRFIFLLLTYFLITPLLAQNTTSFNRKGNLVLNWGYNRASYSKSNLHLTGDGYDFTIEKIVARDAPTQFDWEVYFKPASLSIPQYNFTTGYYLNNNFSLSLNVDHMKYVMQQDQTAKVNGYINQAGNPHNGIYMHQPKVLSKDFLTFEHTDGLNYLSLEGSYTSNLYISEKSNFQIELMGGLSAGILLPKTNAKLFSYPRNDEFHLAGFGVASRVGLNFIFFKKIFIQANLKGGWIDMPDIITRNKHTNDRAKQNFFFRQENFMLGTIISLKKKD